VKMGGRAEIMPSGISGGRPRLNGEENERYFWDILGILQKVHGKVKISFFRLLLKYWSVF